MNVSKHVDLLKNTDGIWIYGAGKIGRRICGLLDVFNITVKGVLVTALEGNPTHLFGIKVFEFDNASVPLGDCIVVAVNDEAQVEILSFLQTRGYQCFFAWNECHINELWMTQNFKFTDRRKHSEKACFVLCGYKDFLWKHVFARLKKFVPKEMDICICSSGIHSDALSEIAEKNNWSYLSTEMNSVTLIQNIAFSIFDDASWIYKMDEDIFITNGLFERLFDAYKNAQKSSAYRIGFAAPLIPLNGFGYRDILERYDCLEAFEIKFGKAWIGGNPKNEIEKNPDAAKFMWGYHSIPKIDRISEDMYGRQWTICNVRFSIGFILFEKNLWERMEGFSVLGNKDLGVDESELCGWCMNESEAIIVAKDAVAGHFSFGKQTTAMTQYMNEHPEFFCLEQ